MENKIKEFLNNKINEKKLSHAFLIETNEEKEIVQEILDIFYKKEMIENKNIENNPYIYVILPENGNILKEKILNLQQLATTKTMNTKIKIYFILQAEKLSISSSNKLLKLLEEPPEDFIGFLITKDKNKLLDTIKSRCQIFCINSNIDNIKNENAIDLQQIISLNYEESLQLKTKLLKLDKNQLIVLFDNLVYQVYESYEISNVAKYYKILDNIIDMLNANVNIELCIDRLFIEMRK